MQVLIEHAVIVAVVWGTVTFVAGLVLGAYFVRERYCKMMDAHIASLKNHDRR